MTAYQKVAVGSNKVLIVVSLLVVVLTLYRTYFFFLPQLPQSEPNALVASHASLAEHPLLVDALLLLFFVLVHSLSGPLVAQLCGALDSPRFSKTVYGLLSCVSLLLVFNGWAPVRLPPLWTAPGWLELPLQLLYGSSWIILLLQMLTFDQLGHINISSTQGSSRATSKLVESAPHPFFITPFLILTLRLALDFSPDKLLFALLVALYLVLCNRSGATELALLQTSVISKIGRLRRPNPI